MLDKLGRLTYHSRFDKFGRELHYGNVCAAAPWFDFRKQMSGSGPLHDHSLGVEEVATSHRMNAENIAAPVSAVVPEWDRRCPRELSTEGSVGARRELRDMLEKSGGELGCCAAGDCRWLRALGCGDHAHGSRFPLTLGLEVFCELGIG